MKKFIISAMAFMAATACLAQKVTAQEPEFIGSYCILTTDSTTEVLPKENGTIKKHQNKFGKISSIAGAVSDLGLAGARIGISAGSLSGVEAGVRVMGTAAGVGVAADAVNTLAGVEGMDIAFSGGTSAYKIKKTNSDVRLIIRAENNDIDPMGIYRIVKFKESKKDRRIQWMEFKPALIGSSETKKKGYVAFSAHKYGEKSYLLNIPASEIEPGEYGIFFMSIISSSELPVGTFSVTK
mgnify:FL=1